MKVVKQRNGYYYFEVGAEEHGKPSYVVWLGKNVLPKDVAIPFKLCDIQDSWCEELTKDYVKLKNEEVVYGLEVKFPLKGFKILQLESGTKILIPDANYTIIDIYIHSGYRGNPPRVSIYNADECFWYYHFHSPRGNLGISKGALCNIKNETQEVFGEFVRDGRLYGEARCGVFKLVPPEWKVEILPEITLKDLEVL